MPGARRDAVRALLAAGNDRQERPVWKPKITIIFELLLNYCPCWTHGTAALRVVISPCAIRSSPHRHIATSPRGRCRFAACAILSPRPSNVQPERTRPETCPRLERTTMNQQFINQQFAACIAACNFCADTCDYCAASCLQEADPKMMARCIALDTDCAQLCRLAAGYMARGSESARTICEACARICTLCADECGKHQMDHCQHCAQACRQCADECRKMVH
jgi:hypothetical protein